MSVDICEVIITASDAEWLVRFTRSLVEDRLVACGQHITPVRSVYRWDGEIQEDTEARVALHTRADLVPAVVERVNREHPYDVPCVLAVPVFASNPAYAQWVLDETGSPE
ncbi:divalent-cation tolerance protein CutA [Saccharothrix violaceirubra]|uniref:Periplasmic divalent cation tolerance protein n=1 Tax=Saccharothrix violaceirubra TaxID=413306 RepID=A0A7W7WY54_9PSEU|nr:divalent-cation tolerance protein CutA [Saccharothrix violaceirubra]MBB4968075.1 periplasmic divalent cation tolerance protein [Saccharothrix violaceirubra]